MKTKALLIELQEDCVFSARAATEGAHESLDRIPGSALLGAAAASRYARLDRRQAYAAFHSGKLRFGDGLPWHGATPGWPMPLCWHHAKTDDPEKSRRLDADKVFNFIHIDSLGENRQPKQMRGGYVHTDGSLSKPEHSLRLKTAIDPDTGRAKESQLFGYDALHRGQCFVSLIEADDDLDDTLFDEACKALEGEVLLGRSRSAEYGRVSIRAIDWTPPAVGQGDNNRITLWLLSDLALIDEHGQPTVTPSGEALGLPGAKMDWEKTFLRTRRYSPWNAARHGYDRERLVIVAGSVLTLELEAPLNDEQKQRLQGGIGLYREAGLGRLWINPPLLSGEHPTFEPNHAEKTSGADIPRPDHPLVGWLEGRDASWKDSAEEQARALETEIRNAISRARKFAGVADDLPYGPSKSQWGTIKQEALNARKASLLFAKLFESDAAIIKLQGEGWNIEIPPAQRGGQWLKLAGWIKQKLAIGNDSDRHYIHKIRVLARDLQDEQRKRRV